MLTNASETMFSASLRVKGYGFREYEESFFKENINRDSNFSLPDERRRDALRFSRIPDRKSVV